MSNSRTKQRQQQNLVAENTQSVFEHDFKLNFLFKLPNGETPCVSLDEFTFIDPEMVHRLEGAWLTQEQRAISRVTRTSLGSIGTNKLFLNELDIRHPAAKLLVLAGKEQHKKFGDGAKLVVFNAGQLLEGAKELIATGLNRSEIINGYRKVSNKVGEILQGLVEEGYKIMVLKIACQFELDYFCRTTDAVALQLKLGSTVDPSYLGYVDSILVEENHGPRVTVTNKQGGVATVLLGVNDTSIIIDGLERAVDNGVNAYKALCTDSRLVPGGGATEFEIARKLKAYSLTETGSDQNAIAKYAESFEMIPKILAENAYLKATNIVSTLYEEHKSGNVKVGIALAEGACKDASTSKIWDLYTPKYHALKNAADAVCNALVLISTGILWNQLERSTRRNG